MYMYDTLLFHNFKFAAWKGHSSLNKVVQLCQDDVLSYLTEIFGEFANLGSKV